jgi:ABC-2 type transport system ATP-binding protein
MVAGCDLLGDPRGVRLRIGYVAQGSATRMLTPVRDELVLQCRLYRMSRPEAEARSDELIRDLDLTGLEQRPTVSLSGGQKRRLDLALGLVHRPAVLFLDEPSAGLDPQSRITLWAQVRRLREEYGTTVFISTHYLEEADELCDRILILDRGAVVVEDSPEHLKAQLGHDVVTVVPVELDRARQILEAQPGAENVTIDGSALRITCESGERMLMEFLRALDQGGVHVQSVSVAQPTLDDVFMSLTHRSPATTSGSPASTHA